MHQIYKGQSYKKLNPSYVIFICQFDIFDAGRHIYTFENMERGIEQGKLEGRAEEIIEKGYEFQLSGNDIQQITPAATATIREVKNSMQTPPSCTSLGAVTV